MTLLNTTFKPKSNTLCNPFLFNGPTIEAMHETMKRLYQAAEELKGWSGQSEVARRLNSSPQALNNWERRGMSKGGMLLAQDRIGCSAVWLETGRGAMRFTHEHTGGPSELLSLWEYLTQAEKTQMIEQMRPMAEHNKEVMDALAGSRVYKAYADRRQEDTPIAFHERRGRYGKDQ